MVDFVRGLLGLMLVMVAFSGCFGVGGGGSDDELNAFFEFIPQPGNTSTFLFDATNSTGDIATYEWNFGEGTFAEGRQVIMEYTLSNATFNVTLVVTGEEGDKDMTFLPVTLGTGVNLPPEVHLARSPRWVPTGGQVILDASASDDHERDTFLAYWTFGPFAGNASGNASGNATGNGTGGMGSSGGVTFDTGYLEEGQVSTQTVTTEGLYVFHCHPHPWMKSRLIVDADAPAVDNATINIATFAFNRGEDLTVPPGTTVTVVNQDPVPHTATLEVFAPGGIAVNDRVFDTGTGLAAGDYQAWLFLDDLKGGLRYQAWGIKASDDAPTVAWTNVNNGQPTTQVDNARTHEIGAFNFIANVSADAGYAALPGAGAMIVFQVIDENGTPATPAAACAGSTCSMTTDLNPGDYAFRFDVSEGGVSSYSISATWILYTFPPFGDVGAGAQVHVH